MIDINPISNGTRQLTFDKISYIIMKRSEQQELDKIIQDNVTYQLTETEFGNIFSGDGLEKIIILTNTTTISNLTGNHNVKSQKNIIQI